jgi:hypothetical protein
MEFRSDALSFRPSAELGDVGAGGKNTVTTGDDHRPWRIALQVKRMFFKLAQQPHRERVDLRVSKSENGYTAGLTV